MATSLIRLEDGTLVEVEVGANEVQQISGGMAKKVESKLDNMGPTLVKTCRPIVSAVKALRAEIGLEEIEVEVGLSFDVEGNIYITKAQFGATVRVCMRLKKLGG